MSLRAAILIISDTASRDAATDTGIPALQHVFADRGQQQWTAHDTRIVPDNVLDIQRAIVEWADGPQPVHLIVTSGGTGFAQRDVTPEAVAPLLHKHASGLVHAMLAASLAITPFACMARPVAGVRHTTLVVTLPGSPKGAAENLEAVLALLPHACQQAAGAHSRTLHGGGVTKLEQEAGVAGGAAASVALQPHAHQPHAHQPHPHQPHPHQPHAHQPHPHQPHAHHGPRAHTTNDPQAGASRRHRESPYPMLPVSEALACIARHTPSPATLTARVDESLLGAVLAADVLASESVPAFRASIVDGYAILASDPPLLPSPKRVFPVVSISHAQAANHLAPLERGQVARITTGAPLPPGATAVVMVEDTIVRKMTDDGKEEAEVEMLTDAIRPGENVREPGSDVKAGATILRRGEAITAVGGEFGLLASVGTREVSIYTRPIVGVLSTGDEIIPHDTPRALRHGEVRDTNRPTLLTAIRAHGYEALDLGIASDQPGALEASLRSAMRKCDVIITSGGVSMGELDLLKPTVERQLGGTIHFGRVSMKPGKPTTFATVPCKSNTGQDETKLIFSLPGNPASAVVTFHLFVLPALHHMSGISPVGLPKVSVLLEQDVRPDPKRAEYHRVVVRVKKSDGQLWATSTGFQRSSAIGSFKGANALLCLPEREGVLRRGAKCEALLMGRIVAEV